MDIISYQSTNTDTFLEMYVHVEILNSSDFFFFAFKKLILKIICFNTWILIHMNKT